MSKDKTKDAVERAREIAKALEDAKDKNPKQQSGHYARVRKARRGELPTFASLPDKPVGEDEDSVVK